MLTVWEDVSNSSSWILMLLGQSIKHFTEVNTEDFFILHKIFFKIQAVAQWP